MYRFGRRVRTKQPKYPARINWSVIGGKTPTCVWYGANNGTLILRNGSLPSRPSPQVESVYLPSGEASGSFISTSSAITLPNGSFGTSDIGTFIVLAKVNTNAGNGVLVSTSPATTAASLRFSWTELRYSIYGSGTPLQIDGIFANGEIAVIALAISAEKTSLYKNGVVVASTASDVRPGVPAGVPQIGSVGGGAEFSGHNIALVIAFDQCLSDAEVAAISANPWQIFEPETIPLFFSTVTAQYARPTSDVSTGTWTASSGSDLFAMLDETTASDADYIVTTGASTCEVALGTLSDPASSTGHIVRYRISATGGGIIVRLRQGTTTIATWTHTTAPTSLTTYAQTLTSGEANSITDYTALKLQFEATA